jgi:hypothetical protein
MSALLADHDRRRLGVAADERGHNRGDDQRSQFRPRTGSCWSTTAISVSSPIKQLPDEVVVGLEGNAPLTNAAVARVMMASDNCLWRLLAICGVPPDPGMSISACPGIGRPVLDRCR